MELLPDKIKRLRASKDMTQLALGKAVGVSRVAVTKWENGDTENLKLANLKRLCAVFGVSVADLIDEKPVTQQEPRSSLQEPASTSYDDAVAKTQVSAFSDPDITAVIELMSKTDKTGRSIALVQVKLALNAYKPAVAKLAS